MNIGLVIYDLTMAMIDLGKHFADLMSAKIDISSLLTMFDLIGVNTTELPSSISVIGMLGGITGIGILALFVIKIVRG